MKVIRIALIALLAGGLLAACGNDKNDNAGSSATTTAAKASAELSVVGKDFSFTTPASIQGGYVKVELANEGKEEHQAQLLRINDGVTPQQLQAAQADPTGEKLLAVVSPKGGVNRVAPGSKQSAVSKLDPGRYLMLCFVRGADGVPHVAKGMVAPLTVSAPVSTAAEPKYGAEVEAKDYSYVLPTFKAGTQTIEVKNTGPSAHEMALYKVADGKTAADAQQFLGSTGPPTGPPPITGAGGSPGVIAGGSTYPTVDLTPGTYVVTCFIPDQNGKPHFALGMFASFQVK